jgi:hypothetical protein
MSKKTVKVKNDVYHIMAGKVAREMLRKNSNIDILLGELIRMNESGRVVLEYSGLNDICQRLDMVRGTLSKCLWVLELEGMIKREGYAIYLHPMITGQFDTLELVKCE